MSGDWFRRGWQEVTAGIAGASAELAALEAQFASTMQDGQALRTFDRALGAALDGKLWDWPLLDGWQGRFEAEGLWPYIWPDFQPDEEEIAEYDARELAAFRRHAATPLISHTAMMTGYRHRNQAMLTEAGVSLRLVSMGDSAEDWVSGPYITALANGDHRHLPPYFPGDRTSVQRLPNSHA